MGPPWGTLDRMTVATELDIRPLSPIIGAEIHGVDLSRPLGVPVVAEIRRALNDHHVIFFRDQDLTPAQQADFARQFGTVTEGHPVIPAIEENPEVLAIDSREDRASWWHTDVTFLEAPAFGSILYMLESPEVGGDTTWASLQDAYDRLAEPVRAMCDTLIAIHFDPWFAADVEARGGYEWQGVRHKKLLPALHPVVRTHPENGRNGLFVNQQFTQTILGLSKNESNAILDMLYRHCQQPELTCRFRWRPGSVAFWDNRATLHYALDDYGDATRIAHRVTLEGDIPFGPAKPAR
jgi:alpha-ketoglutarate-dependent sulfate ester dioxygenase